MSKSQTGRQFFEEIDAMTGGGGHQYEITAPDEPHSVEVMIYEDVPDDDMLCAVTFGLSSVHHSEWVLSKPELLLTVRSQDHSWGLCLGEIVRLHRNTLLFEEGSILNFRHRVSEDSEMTSFLLYTSTVLDTTQQQIRLPDRVVVLTQAYPIHEEEIPILRLVGLERFFWDLAIDFEDVRRPPTRF